MRKREEPILILSHELKRKLTDPALVKDLIDHVIVPSLAKKYLEQHPANSSPSAEDVVTDETARRDKPQKAKTKQGSAPVLDPLLLPLKEARRRNCWA